jgi:cytochrome c-type biogenesis protein CcmH/NrfG/predicted RNA-binding Zn-ribbon protein involved in translation (DUF1610 family)
LQPVNVQSESLLPNEPSTNEPSTNEPSEDAIDDSIEESPKQQCAVCGVESSMEERTVLGTPELCPNCGAEVIEAPLAVTSAEEFSVERSTKAPTTQQLLLDRLMTTGGTPKQIPQATLLVIIFAIVAAGIGVYLATKQPDKYLAEQAGPSSQSQADPHGGMANDTTELHQKRVFLQPIIDSLKRVIAANPADTSALLDLGNVYFDVQYWPETMHTYENYLKANPSNANIRIEYAAAIERSEHDHEAALNQIEKALEDDPKNVRGLFTAGMIASMKIGGGGDHTEAVAQAKTYFIRAKAAAEERDTAVLPAINDMLSKFESMKAPAQ